MSLTINSSHASSIANRALTNVSNAMDRALAKLSSGSRVASARDDAASLAIGSRIRGEMAGLLTQKQNATQAVAVMQVAEGAYQRVNDMLVRMQSLAAQAQSRSLSATERGMLDTEFQQIKAEITRLGKSMTFNGSNIFDIGSTTLATATSYASGSNTVLNQAVADVNGDGIMDILNPEGFGGGNLFVSYGNGDGTFQTARVLISAGFALAGLIKAGDFDGDGDQDIVMTNEGDTARIYMNNGAGSFTAAQTFTGLTVYDIIAGDFNGDGKDDIAISNDDSTLDIITIGSNGAFTSQTTILANSAYSLSKGDVNNDGIMDIVAITTAGVVSILGSTRGTYTIGTTRAIAIGCNFNNNFSVADMNNDGLLDVITQDNGAARVQVLLNSGGGNWAAATNVAIGSLSSEYAQAADINGDGLMDIVSFDGSNRIYYRLGTGIMTFGTQVQMNLTLSTPMGLLQMADFNRDGKIDFLGTDGISANIILNNSIIGQQGSVRVGANAATSNNISYRLGSVRLNSLAQGLEYSMIKDIGTAKRADKMIRDALTQLTLFRTSVGAAINRLDAVQTNIANQIENQEAARSAYLDLDVASEMAQYTAQKVTMQAGISMLAQASSTQRLIAQLLQSGAQ